MGVLVRARRVRPLDERSGGGVLSSVKPELPAVPQKETAGLEHSKVAEGLGQRWTALKLDSQVVEQSVDVLSS